jgi:hypothetical protein
MGGEVARAFVCLRLDDASDLPAGGTGVDEVHAEQVARDEKRFARIEGEGKEGG